MWSRAYLAGPRRRHRGRARGAAAQVIRSPVGLIFAASDTQAIGVLAAADRLGVAIPERLSVVGFDDIEFGLPASAPSGSRWPSAGPRAHDGCARCCAGRRSAHCGRNCRSSYGSGAVRPRGLRLMPWASRLGMADEVTLAGHADDHALTLQDLQGPGGHPVRDMMMLGDRVDRRDPAGEGPLRNLSRSIFATRSYGGTAESGLITWASLK